MRTHAETRARTQRHAHARRDTRTHRDTRTPPPQVLQDARPTVSSLLLSKTTETYPRLRSAPWPWSSQQQCPEARLLLSHEPPSTALLPGAQAHEPPSTAPLPGAWAHEPPSTAPLPGAQAHEPPSTAPLPGAQAGATLVFLRQHAAPRSCLLHVHREHSPRTPLNPGARRRPALPPTRLVLLDGLVLEVAEHHLEPGGVAGAQDPAGRPG